MCIRDSISKKQRAIRANKSGADICIRLHADAASANVRGVSVLSPSQQNPYVAKLSKKSKKLSKNILDSYCKSTKLDVYKRQMFILVKTSNPSSGEFQDQEIDGKPLYEMVAEKVASWGEELMGEDVYKRQHLYRDHQSR